jgi:hypothetical protein
LVSRNAIPLARTSLHAQDSAQRLPINRDGHEIVTGGDLIRGAAESSKPASTNWCATKGLRNEAQRAEPATATTAAALTRSAEQVAERRQEGRVRRRIARFAAALAPRRGCRPGGRCGARRRLTRTLVESARGIERCTTPAATSATAAFARRRERPRRRLLVR